VIILTPVDSLSRLPLGEKEPKRGGGSASVHAALQDLPPPFLQAEFFHPTRGSWHLQPEDMQRSVDERGSLTLAQSQGNRISYTREQVEHVIAICQRARSLSVGGSGAWPSWDRPKSGRPHEDYLLLT
jgi:hypothetical protein